MTKREQVWRCIKNSEYAILPLEIAEQLGFTHQSVKAHLKQLRKTHKFIREGAGKYSAYLVPVGHQFVGDRRGKSEGSKATRQNWPSAKGSIAASERARAERTAREADAEPWGGAHRVTRAPPTRLTDLDRCWANVVKRSL